LSWWEKGPSQDWAPAYSAKYQGTGDPRDSFNGVVGFEETFVNNFRIIGQGPGNNFLVHENFHITVNVNGTLTVFRDNFSVECK
jgi:hypothetical protein